MSIVLWAQEAVFTHVIVGWDRFMLVMYLGRAPRTKETLPYFLKVALGNPTSTCIPQVDSQRTPGFWGVRAWYQSLGIRIPRDLGFGYPSPLGGLMWRIGI